MITLTTKKIGQLLIEDFRVTKEQVNIALDFQQNIPRYRELKIGEILLDLGWLESKILEKYLRIQSGSN